MKKPHPKRSSRYITVLLLGTAMLIVSCASPSRNSGAILEAARPTQTLKPDAAPTTSSIKVARVNSGASMDAIKRAKAVARIADVNSERSRVLITDYENLITELQRTDDAMAVKFAALTREAKLLDAKRVSTINELKAELEDAEGAIYATTNALDDADEKITKLTQQVEKSWTELTQHRQQREALEGVVIQANEDLARAEAETTKYKTKYQKLMKYKWVVLGAGAWLILKIIIGLSSFTPQGRIAKALIG